MINYNFLKEESKNVKCIYCLKESPEIEFTKKEHVLPKSFGSFKDNLTLDNIVCDSCNQFFGDNLELVLARGTPEGLDRYIFGIKSKDEYKGVGKKNRYEIKRGNGPFKGAHAKLEYSPQAKDFVSLPLPQVGFLKDPNTKEYTYYLLNEIPSKEILLKEGFHLDNIDGIIGLGTDLSSIIYALKQKGIDFKISDLPAVIEGVEGEQPHKMVYSIDHVVMRAFSKIAFNYLAYCQPDDFIFHSDFDIIRNYIRYDLKPKYPIFLPTCNPVLGDEQVGWRRQGHIITVDWAEDKISICAQVTMFNKTKFIISLVRNFSGEHRDIRKGTIFNFNTGEISELGYLC